METVPIKSRLIKPEEDLKTVILQAFRKNKIRLKNGDILVVTSKIVALSQGRIFSYSLPGANENKKSKSMKDLLGNEADVMLGEGEILLTLKDGILIPQAGIDISNAPRGSVILWPKNPWDVAHKLLQFFKKQFGLKKMGVIISDSHCQPLRWGTTGLALAFMGFFGVEDARGKKDLFRKPLRVTKIAVADNIASAALLEMGEAGEKIPFVICRDANVRFSSKKFSKRDISIKPKDCLFAALYPKNWKK